MSNTAAMASIHDLPNEIVHLITKNFSSDDIFNLRQTCKDLNLKTLYHFAERYFETRCVMLERRSLETLVEISQHPYFGPSVGVLVVSSDHLLPFDDLWVIEPPDEPTYARWVSFYAGEWPKRDKRFASYHGLTNDDDEDSVEVTREGGDDESEEGSEENVDDDSEEDSEHNGANDSEGDSDDFDQESSSSDDSQDEDASPWNFKTRRTPKRLLQLNESAYRESLADQDELLRTGYGTKCLTKAIKKLVNCRELLIIDEKKPWGLKHLQRKIGVLPQRCFNHRSSASVHFTRNLIHSVSVSLVTSEQPIKEFIVGLGASVEYTSQATADMLVRPTASILDQARVPSVTSLSLYLYPANSNPDSADSKRWETDMAQFVNRFPNISRFSLEYGERDRYLSYSHHDPSWHYSDVLQPSRFSKLSSMLYLPKLEVLEISQMDCNRIEFGFFLLRHSKTLRDIRIAGINLVDDDMAWSWMINIMRQNLRITNFSFDELAAKGKPTLCGDLYQVRDDEGLGELLGLLDKEKGEEEAE